MKSLVDMRRSQPEATEMSAPELPAYPYGLSICLTEAELEKLGVDTEDWKVGDSFSLDAMAKITSISENETEHGKTCRVEMQITHLGGEEEDNEAA